jgi:3'(2'), 5'-bisphosphate nucleotidase
MEPPMNEMMSEIIKLAKEAGKIILGKKQGELGVEKKQDGSPVTIADKASHEHILAGLNKLTPPIPVISEEGDPERVGHRLRAQNEPIYWLVDPLDGTKEFLKENGDYTVNIALVKEGIPILGVIYVPEHRVSYFAATETGSYRQKDGQPPVKITGNKKKRPLKVVASRSHFSKETKEFIDKLGAVELIHRGSSVKICAVAEGSADLYPRLGPTYLWDTAAGCIIAREAGCELVDLDGKQMFYGLDEGLKKEGFVVKGQGINY